MSKVGFMSEVGTVNGYRNKIQSFELFFNNKINKNSYAYLHKMI